VQRSTIENVENPLALVTKPDKEAAANAESFSPGGGLSPMMLKASMFKTLITVRCFCI
jgi:hypothetical protein